MRAKSLKEAGSRQTEAGSRRGSMPQACAGNAGRWSRELDGVYLDGSLARHGHSSCPQDNDDFQVIVEAVANPACCLIRYLFQLVESRALLEHNHYFEFITI